MKTKLVSTKNFVAKHRVAISVTVTAAACLTMNRMALKEHNDFLKEHDLFDAFYTPDSE